MSSGSFGFRLNEDLVVKVADFGMSKENYEKEHSSKETKKRALPIRWMSIEAIQNGTFTTQSDVVRTFPVFFDYSP